MEKDLFYQRLSDAKSNARAKDIYEVQLVRQLIIYIKRKLGEERHQFLAYDSKNESKVHKFVCRTVKETNTNTYTNTNTNTNVEL